MSQPLKSGMPENDGCEMPWTADQKKMFWGGGIGGGVGAILGFSLTLTPVFTQLSGSANFGRQVFAATLLTAITGAIFGALVASPSCNEKKTLPEELSSREKAEAKRADTAKLAEANRQNIHYDL